MLKQRRRLVNALSRSGTGVYLRHPHVTATEVAGISSDSFAEKKIVDSRGKGQYVNADWNAV